MFRGFGYLQRASSACLFRREHLEIDQCFQQQQTSIDSIVPAASCTQLIIAQRVAKIHRENATSIDYDAAIIGSGAVVPIWILESWTFVLDS